MENTHTIACKCGHCIIQLWKEEDTYNIALYENQKGLNLFQRLRKALNKDKYLLEDVTLYQEDMDKLIDFVKTDEAPTNSKSEASNTGYKGIYLQTQEGRTPTYIAQIVNRAKNEKVNKIYIGNYSTVEEAVKAREEFIKDLL